MKKNILITVLFFLCIHTCCAQYTIKGKVTDEQQNPLQGVSITIEKNLAATFSDSAGNYTLSFSSLNAILTFTHIGYQPVMMKIKEGNVQTVTLLRSNIFLSETVVNAFERNSNIRNIPAAVTVLTKAMLNRYGNESFVPAINTVPGVKMDERSPGSYRISIRGNLLRSTFGVRNVKVYWNGIPLTDANGNTYFNELAMSNTGKIEIIKGPSGSLYGAGTGGVVLMKSNIDQEEGKRWHQPQGEQIEVAFALDARIDGLQPLAEFGRHPVAQQKARHQKCQRGADAGCKRHDQQTPPQAEYRAAGQGHKRRAGQRQRRHQDIQHEIGRSRQPGVGRMPRGDGGMLFLE